MTQYFHRREPGADLNWKCIQSTEHRHHHHQKALDSDTDIGDAGANTSIKTSTAMNSPAGTPPTSPRPSMSPSDATLSDESDRNRAK